VQVKLPVDEPVTVVKVSVHDKKLSLFTGKAVASEQLFPGWEDIVCRTKLAIDADAQKLFTNLDWNTFGVHRVVFYGDHRQAFRDLAIIMRYEAIEKDR